MIDRVPGTHNHFRSRDPEVAAGAALHRKSPVKKKQKAQTLEIGALD